MIFISALIGLASTSAAPPNCAGLVLGNEAPVDRLVEPARRRHAPQPAARAICDRVAVGLATPSLARQAASTAIEVIAGDARRLPRPGRPGRRCRAASSARATAPSSTVKPRLSRIRLLALGRHVEPAQRQGARRIEGHRLVRDRRLAGADDAARLAAANVEDQAGQDRQAVVEEGRVDAALEAAARVAGQLQRLAGAGDALGVEISDFEQDVGGRRRRPRYARRP